MPIGTELLIEMIASGDSVTVLPTWIAAPFLSSHNLRTVQVGRSPLARTWYCATRHGRLSESVEVTTRLIIDHFAEGSTTRGST